jgi:hypothetical protein
MPATDTHAIGPPPTNVAGSRARRLQPALSTRSFGPKRLHAANGIKSVSLLLILVATSFSASTADISFVDSGQNLGDGRTFNLALGDVDGDGDLDALITYYVIPSKVWVNNGEGLFADSGQSLGGPSGHGVALGDLDGDDDLDAFVVFNTATDRVYANNGSGVFVDSGQVLGSPDDWGTTVTLGDLDGGSFNTRTGSGLTTETASSPTRAGAWAAWSPAG